LFTNNQKIDFLSIRNMIDGHIFPWRNNIELFLICMVFIAWGVSCAIHMEGFKVVKAFVAWSLRQKHDLSFTIYKQHVKNEHGIDLHQVRCPNPFHDKFLQFEYSFFWYYCPYWRRSWKFNCIQALFLVVFLSIILRLQVHYYGGELTNHNFHMSSI
jgi:hypothetical protein